MKKYLKPVMKHTELRSEEGIACFGSVTVPQKPSIPVHVGGPKFDFSDLFDWLFGGSNKGGKKKKRKW